jgi:peptidyl-prolyl cis-trans isomerase SurA
MYPRPQFSGLAICALLSALACSAPALAQNAAGQSAPGTAAPAGQLSSLPPDRTSIVAVVNGDVISLGDVQNRGRLFAISTGMPASREVLDRLTPQVIRQLIDERLRLQEAQRRHVVVSDQEIAHAIGDVEARNGMPPGALRHKLSADGVSFRTLVDQIRVQIGWTRVLREVLGPQAQVTDSDIAERERVLKEQLGRPEYRVSEIFIPVENLAATEEAQRFADVVIQQLRAGAPFPVVAAQFSQSQTALQGGDLGWVQQNQMDPDVLRVVNEMPPGAISNPIRVPGGFSIVTLRAKREIGHDPATMLKIRQAFFPFTTRLDPNNPTEQQKQALDQARRLSASAKSCDAIEAAAKSSGGNRPVDPGDVRLDQLQGPLKAVLSSLPDGKPTQPLVAEDGILVMMICSREEKNLGIPSREETTDHILGERIELASRQLLRDLQRRAIIDQRS